MNTESKIIWEKVPSVTGGGKAYFLYAPQHRLHIVWDRRFEVFALTRENRLVGHYKTIALAKLACTLA